MARGGEWLVPGNLWSWWDVRKLSSLWAYIPCIPSSSVSSASSWILGWWKQVIRMIILKGYHPRLSYKPASMIQPSPTFTWRHSGMCPVCPVGLNFTCVILWPTFSSSLPSGSQREKNPRSVQSMFALEDTSWNASLDPGHFSRTQSMTIWVMKSLRWARPAGHENLWLRHVPVLLWIPARLHDVLNTQGNWDIWIIMALGHCSYAFSHYTLDRQIGWELHMGRGGLMLPPLYGPLGLKALATVIIKSIGHPLVSQIGRISHPLVPKAVRIKSCPALLSPGSSSRVQNAKKYAPGIQCNMCACSLACAKMVLKHAPGAHTCVPGARMIVYRLALINID